MSVLKVIGWVAMGGLLIAGSIGGVWWWQKRQRKDASPGPTPSNPPRKKTESADERPARNQRQHTLLQREHLSPEIIEDFDAMFGEGWPATDEAIDKLERGDVIVFVAESQPTDDFDRPKQEIINASVLTVGNNEIRARVIPPIAHADHFGNSAGHGLYVGALVEVPRSRVMVAARRNADPDAPTSGYGSKGEPAQVFKPSGRNGLPFKVHPSTVYELELLGPEPRAGEVPPDRHVRPAASDHVHRGQRARPVLGHVARRRRARGDRVRRQVGVRTRRVIEPVG